MTIIEALNSNRPFRRINDPEGWICYNANKNGGWFFKVSDPSKPFLDLATEEIGTSLDLYREEILASDWEIY